MIRIGILGCSNIAERAVIPAICSMSDRFELAGVASRTAPKAEAFARKFPCRYYGSYDALLEAEDIDAVYIPLPTGLHYEWITKALQRKLHVFSEKSLVCELGEANALSVLAKKNNCVVVENFQFRFHPQLAVIKDLINDGTLGELRCLRVSFGFPPFADIDNIRYQKHLGGGALLDAGAYTLKVSQEILGPDLRVDAAVLNYQSEYEVDIWGGGLLKQEDGSMFSQIAFGFDQHYQCELELWGSKAKLTANRIFTAPPEYEVELILEKGGRSEFVRVEPANHFINMLQHFSHLVMHPESRLQENAQNIRQAELLEEFRKKANE